MTRTFDDDAKYRFATRTIHAGQRPDVASGAIMTPIVRALLAFAVLHGLAWGVRGPFMQAIRADYFGRTFIGSILGISAIIAAAGQIFGPLLAGVLGDATGNYKLGFTVLAVIAACGSVLFLAAKRPPPPARLRPPSSAPA